jgi:pimeloyl-ACP methyl ester carboxylesterase
VPAASVPGGQPPLTGSPDDAARRVTSTAGISIALHDVGGGERAEPLLMVHPTGFHGRVWAPCAEHLPWRCWAPDLRGHGASPLPPGSFTGDEPDPELLGWERVTDDVLAAVDAVVRLGGTDDGLLAVGHSMGGALLLRAELRRPGTFRGLYLYEPVVFPLPPPGPPPENPLAAGARRRRPRFESIEAALTNYAAKPPLDAFHPAALDAYVRHGFRSEPDGSVVLACTPAVESTLFAQAMVQDTFTHLGEVGCPATIATGRDDGRSRPAQVAGAIAAALPRGELVVHADLGHFGPQEDPATIAAEITARFSRFLQGH